MLQKFFDFQSTVCVTHVLNIANTLVADGIHQVHFTGAGRSEGFGGNRRIEINCKHITLKSQDIKYLLPEEFC